VSWSCELYLLFNGDTKSWADRCPVRLGYGEVVVLQDGKPHFGLLLSRNQTSAPFKISVSGASAPGHLCRIRSALRPVRIAVGPATEHAPGTAGEVDATISPPKMGLFTRRGWPRQGVLRGGLPARDGRSDGQALDELLPAWTKNRRLDQDQAKISKKATFIKCLKSRDFRKRLVN
jgi:hypothetical protein